MADKLPLYTIGFTQKSAEKFFGLLEKNRVKTLVDIRLKPESQLSGFAKKQDLPYFLQALTQCRYEHRIDLAPDTPLFSQYRKDKDWSKYEPRYLDLIHQRHILDQIDIDQWRQAPICLLCSEHLPHQCHRRLLAEYIAHHYPEFEIIHLK